MGDVATSGRLRHPVFRTGERDPIDPYKRRLIYERDGYACGYCGWQLEPDCRAPGAVLQLDHIMPWSAMGSDRSDNLRSLCGQCNEERSNYVDDNPPRVTGVTRSCYWCALRHDDLPEHLIGVEIEELSRVFAYCGRCSLTSWVPDEGWLL
ncbi:MAG: HNH endonuclease [Chloroflexota bacterium]